MPQCQASLQHTSEKIFQASVAVLNDVEVSTRVAILPQRIAAVGSPFFSPKTAIKATLATSGWKLGVTASGMTNELNLNLINCAQFTTAPTSLSQRRLVIVIFYHDAPPDQLFFDFSGQSSCLVLERRAIFEVAPFRLEALCRHVFEHVLLFRQGFRIQRKAAVTLQGQDCRLLLHGLFDHCWRRHGLQDTV